MGNTVAYSSAGDFEGLAKNDTVIFKGIQYAYAPRFLPPEPVERHSGIKLADRFGQVSYQAKDAMGGLLSGPEPDVSEECLFLNVHTPAVDDLRRPVMVWIHGGAFIGGSGSTPWYNGTSFAKNHGVVLVTINYRLGALGFLDVSGYFGDRYQSSGLTGILDQVAALKWVNENIAAFGGDPENVTVFGESAGAMSVGTLLGIKEARTYFKRAILQSGASRNCITRNESQKVADTFLKILGFDSPEMLLTSEANLLLEKQAQVTIELLGNKSYDKKDIVNIVALPFQPAVDNKYLMKSPIEAIVEGEAKDISIIVGTNSDEWKLFSLMEKGPETFDEIEKRISFMIKRDSLKDDLLSHYRKNNQDITPGELWNLLMTDFIFRVPAVKLLNAQTKYQENCYQYLFSWQSKAFGGVLGACHALEIPFVFNSLDAAGVNFVTGDGPPAKLGDIMNEMWANFAKSGDPNNENGGIAWPKYDSDDPHLLNFNIDLKIEKTDPIAF